MQWHDEELEWRCPGVAQCQGEFIGPEGIWCAGGRGGYGICEYVMLGEARAFFDSGCS
jgi:hypothetical protein